MSRPWTLPGAEYNECADDCCHPSHNHRKEINVSQSSPAINDFSTIKANLERIRKEQEQVEKTETKPTAEEDPLWDYGCNGTETTYDLMMEAVEQDMMGKFDPRVIELCKKYGLKLENESLQKYGRKLTSLECHDMVCKIAETVVV